jgi:hypothetical protein
MSDGREEREDERTRQEQAVKEGRVKRPSRRDEVEPIVWEPERKDS